MQGFGQVYERYGRLNLARLVVTPEARGCGLGQQLVNALIRKSRSTFDLDEAGLFVYTANEPAYCCYRAAGLYALQAVLKRWFPLGSLGEGNAWHAAYAQSWPVRHLGCVQPESIYQG